MTTFLQNLHLTEVEGGKGEFVPVARYYPGMDFLLYLSEDVGYRADRVDAFLTVLWHPKEDRLVGVKLKGIRHFFQNLRTRYPGVGESHFRSLVSILAAAMMEGGAQAIVSAQEAPRRARLHEKYVLAIKFAVAVEQQNGESIEQDELVRLAA